MDKIPKVSIVVPVYNVGHYFRACIESLVNQTLKEIEIVCVDDASTDGSEEILRASYATRDSRVVPVFMKQIWALFRREKTALR